MKNLGRLISCALIVFLGVFLSMSLCSCSEDYSDTTKRVSPTPPPTPDPDPDPTPDPSDSTDNTWRWNTIVDQTVSFDVATEVVEANNIAQLSKSNGETKLDSATLRYQFDVALTAPTRIVTSLQDTTVYSGKGIQKSEYGEFYRQGNDSLHTVTTTVEGGFKTSYYTLGLTTTRKEGFSPHAGKWLGYKNVTETSAMTSLWHEPIVEVEVNDSIVNREKSHAVITITVKSDKGKTWRIKREKIVVVDHFVKIREEKKEEEKIKWDYDVEGLGRMVSLTINIRPDTNTPYVCAHFEGAKGHTFIVDNYDKDGKYTGHTEKHFLSYDIAEKSNDYNGVGFIKGNFYPGYIEYTIDKKDKKCGWVITCRAIGIEDNAPQQSVDGGYANTCGLKNFHESNSAYTTPFIKNNTSTSKEVNGKKVWYVSGKTSEKRELVHHTVIDSSLK